MDFLRRLFGPSPESKPEEAAGPPAITDAPSPAATTPLTPPPVPLKTRPLAPPKSFKSRHRRIRFGAASDVGGRANNEDASLTLLVSAESTGDPPAMGLFIVADGMGGHENGEYASATVVNTLAQHVIDEVILPHLEGRERTADQKTIPEVLADAMSEANTIVQLNFPGGGTTATCAVIRDDLAYLAHVGDSRAYLISDNNLEQVTRDHLLVRRLEELGQLTPEEAEVHPQRNVLYRAIGQAEALEVDPTTRRLPPSSRLLLCSDGLWGVIGDEGIMEILNECAEPQEACEHLIAAANACGGPDNITAVLIQMPD